jgi:hypothetical protein
MYAKSLTALVAIALTGMIVPAEAVWTGYISHPLGFAFQTPVEMAPGTATYRGPVAGQHRAMVWTATQDNIEYQATVVDLNAQANQSATLLGEAEYMFQDGKKLLDDHVDRVETHYGRNLVIDLPNNGGRRLAAFYFVNGRLISLQATIRPANGDYDNPDVVRFIDSISFALEAAVDDSTELALPK